MPACLNDEGWIEGRKSEEEEREGKGRVKGGMNDGRMDGGVRGGGRKEDSSVFFIFHDRTREGAQREKQEAPWRAERDLTVVSAIPCPVRRAGNATHSKRIVRRKEAPE